MVVLWLQPSVNNGMQLQLVQPLTQPQLKPWVVATSKKKVEHRLGIVIGKLQ